MGLSSDRLGPKIAQKVPFLGEIAAKPSVLSATQDCLDQASYLIGRGDEAAVQNWCDSRTVKMRYILVL